MTTQKLYLASDDLACSAIVTHVSQHGDHQVVKLDRTLFHPQGGGQKADRGTIDNSSVIDVRHADNGEVLHLVSEDSFDVGQSVYVAVDHAWRDECSKWHSGGHLIADCIMTLDPNLKAVRGHHWPNEGRVEFVGDAIGLGALVERCADALQDCIDRDISFKIVGNPYSSRALQIGSNEPVPCGGTHVSSASALTGLHIRKVQQKEGILRISYNL